MSENSDSQGTQATEHPFELEGMDPQEALEILEGPAQDLDPTSSGEPAVSTELSSRLQRLKVDVNNLPEPIRTSPEVLERMANSLEEREKDFQRGFTQKSMELGQKARAFELLSQNPRFQEWANTYMNPESKSHTTDEEPPEGLEGKALLNWYIDRGVQKGVKNMLDTMGIPQSLQHISTSLSETQKSILHTKYPDFQDLEPKIVEKMQEFNVPAEKAYHLVKAESVDVNDLKEQARKEAIDDIKKQLADAKNASTVMGTRGSSLNKEFASLPGDSLDEAIRKAWDEAEREVG